MEYKLEKEYTVSAEIVGKGYKSFQKKFVYPKNIIFAVMFFLLTADFVYAAVKAPDNFFVYLLIVLCLAMGLRELLNPVRIRQNIIETVRSMGEPVYKIAVSDEQIEISTVSAPSEIEPADDDENDETDEEAAQDKLPEPSVLPVDSELSISEFDDYFMLYYGKTVFYIIPKKDFNDKELDIIRNVNSSINGG